MNRKKKTLSLLTGGFVVALASFYAAAPPPPPPPPPQNDFEQNPPVATNFWVQKIKAGRPDGSTMLIGVKYQELEPMPLQLPVYVGSNSITLYDDGTHGDVIPNDSVYTGATNENPQDFVAAVNARIQAISNLPYLLTFQGHVGTQISNSVSFNTAAFNNFAPVSLSPALIGSAGAAAAASPSPSGTAGPCTPVIQKENSLFITDLLVVEDPSRTFNAVTGTGNPNGIWTFNTMITNIAGGTSPTLFLQNWLQNFVNDVPVNGQLINHRANVVNLFIAPWLTKAGAVGPITVSNWMSVWNATSIANPAGIMENAPFKLTAIVNRLDLRGNSGYSGGISNSGETRFIFTLIDPNLGDGPPPFGNGGLTTGLPPVQDSNEAPPRDFMDWKGMNIIFEYGNTETSLCDVVAFANQWVNLSTMPLGSPQYLDTLEAITHTVIDMGAGAAAGKINGSAINRLRTNERIFDTAAQFLIAPWSISDWEFRQFELQPGGFLGQVALTNTPVNSANAINNTGPGSDINFPFPFGIAPVPTIPLSSSDQDNLMNWVFSSPANVTNVLNGNHNMPPSFGGMPLLSGGARVDYEYLHYIDMNWSSTAPNYVAYSASTPVAGNPMYKQLRQQLSLNTCQGCHNGETKTFFTHVNVMGYGVTAKYWNNFPTPPDVTVGEIDGRFVQKASPINYMPPPNPEFSVNVSGFLTGENFRNPVGGGSNYYDDFNDPIEDLTDNTMNGLFYVNAPDNYPTNTIGLPTFLFGYNDLQRRQQDLAMLACTDCTMVRTLPLLGIIIGIPLPFGGH